jgi:hypothetical protein
MGMNVPIVMYTHTDYKDVWPAVFGRIKKYIENPSVYVFVNKEDEEIPSEFKAVTYTDGSPYTVRLKECLGKLDEDVILFMHEDMILYGNPKFDYIEKYSNYIKSGKVDSIKLIYVKDSDTVSDFDETLISNKYAKFSIQPTLISVGRLVNILNSNKDLNIWDFEINTKKRNDYMCKVGNEQKRGMFHYDSYVFPYIATAIAKGVWNLKEYPNELQEVSEEYDIDLTKRGSN